MMASWDRLNERKRFQLQYPSEHVVRFLSTIAKPSTKYGLDIGCGHGRHLRLMRKLHFKAEGIDFSRNTAATHVCPMTRLPFDDDSFDVALAYAVFYYATFEEGQQAINEMRRILRPGGQALVCVRTTRDWRAHDLQPSDPEWGMTMHFIDEQDISRTYGQFTELHYELSEWTINDRARLNSDWLITVRK